MKARPRQAENRVAEILSDFFIQYGLSPVERIPILGREGPDITLNEARVVIDVKSRKACPKSVFKELAMYEIADDGELMMFPLGYLNTTLMSPGKNGVIISKIKPSKTVHDWFDHMDDWTRANTTDGITALVLHIPQMPYGNAALILKQSDIGLLIDRLKDIDTVGRGDACLRLGKGEIGVITGLDEKTIQLTESDYERIQEWTYDREISKVEWKRKTQGDWSMSLSASPNQNTGTK